MTKAVFLDTQIYLHYQSFDQIKWLDVLEGPKITIIILPVTIRELNKHKDLHSRKRVRNRAGQVLKRLFSLFESSSRACVRENVEMYLEDRDPTIDFATFRLSREIQDDQLIASIIMFRDENPGKEVVLVTSDRGLILKAKARRLGISTIRLPHKYKLPEEPHPEQARIKELEDELRELKLQIPQLFLIFESGEKHSRFTLVCPDEPAQDELEDKIRRIKQQHSKMQYQPPEKLKGPEHLRAVAKTIADLNAQFNALSPEDIDDYNERLDDFYQAYDEYLKRDVRYQNLLSRTIKLRILVVNDGGAPAEDIDVFLHFPDGFRLMDEKELPKSPKRPKPPQKPKTKAQRLVESFYWGQERVSLLTSYTPDPIRPVRNVSAPHIKKTNGYDVSFHVDRLKHNLKETCDPLYVIFESIEEARSFHIDYRMLAADVSDEIDGELHVIVERD